MEAFAELQGASKLDLKAALAEARNNPLQSCRVKFVLPVVKLGEEKTYAPWKETLCPGITIKLQDMLNSSGKSERPIVEEVVRAGGIHEYLDFEGNIILSSIMRDRTIFGYTKERYAELINEIKPDYYLTPDGETYRMEPHLSSLETARILKETEYLVEHCSDATPIGLVKGCDPEQILESTVDLKALGISYFLFHAGDYISRGSNAEEEDALTFSKIIRKEAHQLLIYGVGSQKYFIKFNLADGFITQSHFVKAFYGQKIADNRFHNGFVGPATKAIIMSNLRELEDELISLQSIPELSRWSRLEEVEKEIKISIQDVEGV